MRAAAEIEGRPRLNDANHVAVLFPSHPDRSGLSCFLERKHACDQMRVVADHLVDAVGDGTPLFGRQRTFRRAEVEAHAVDANPRTSLIYLVAEHVFERALQKMRGRVVPPNLAPPRFKNAGADPIAGRELAV